MEEKKYLKWYQKIGYASGDAAANCGYALITSFMLIYLTNSVGLNSAIIGVLMMISKIFDGVTDVFFGTMIDRTKSKLGKARPWMLYGQIGVSASLFLVFCIPSMNQTMQYIYFFVFYTAFNAVFFTANNIAYSTLSALITRNSQERVQLGSIRFMFSTVTYMSVMSLTTGLVEKFGGGAQGWRMVALLFAVLGLIINTVSVFSVKELPDDDEKTDKTTEKEEKLNLADAFKLLVKNHYYLIIVGLYILYYGANGITSAAGIYFFTYYFEQPALLGLMSLASMIPMVVVLAFTPMIVKKIGSMRNVNIIGYVIASIAGALQIVAALQKNIPLFMAFAFVRSFGMAPFTGTINALIAETADYTWRTQGVRIDGTMFSCSSIGVKVGGGIGSAVVGFLIAAGGFVGTATTQSASAINMIFFTNLVLPVIIGIGIIVLLFMLKVEKANRELAEKVL